VAANQFERFGGVEARAAQTVWSGLVIANNVAKPEPVSPDLTYLEETLKDWFGYNQYKVIGQSRKILVTGSEDWLAQSKYFSLHIDSKEGNDKTGYRVNLKLFQERNLILLLIPLMSLLIVCNMKENVY